MAADARWPPPGRARRPARARRWSWCSLLLGLGAPLGASAQATYPSAFEFSWCNGADCYDHAINAAHFQLRINSYYAENRRPPLKEAFFIITLPAPYQRELLFGCPGLMVSALMLLAEARLYTSPPGEAAALVSRALAITAMPEMQGPHLEGIRSAWPFVQALERYESTLQRLDTARPLSVDFVLPRCREDLSWLADRERLEVLPERTRIFVYEKCEGTTAPVPNLNLSRGEIKVFHVKLDDAADPHTGLAARRDECTAYLAHTVSHHGDPEMGDVTLFLHGDPRDHTPMGLLNIMLKGLALGTLQDVDFVHLGTPRLVHTSNPCQGGLFEVAFGRAQKKPLSTYCCSQFAVSKRRIMSRPLEDYMRMYSLVDGSTPDVCDRIGPSYERYAGARLSHCFFFEFMWHVVFGEDEALPLRSDDARLPPQLRLKDAEETAPSVWRSFLSPFVGGRIPLAGQGDAQPWLQMLLSQGELENRVQVNYGDLAV